MYSGNGGQNVSFWGHGYVTFLDWVAGSGRRINGVTLHTTAYTSKGNVCHFHT